MEKNSSSFGNSTEMQCHWHFKAGVDWNVGPTDAAGQNFDGSWDSLIRECIQNSLDAVLDKSQPVVVQIKFSRFSNKNFPNFFELSKHIKACIDTFPDTARGQYGPMLDLLISLSQPGKYMGYLGISDYNTKGMVYQADNDSCNFSAFVRGVGVHGGDQGASGRGGSFGLGKSTIFTMSPIRTMLVSTMTPDNQFVFEGVTALTTHRMDGDKFSHMGFYDNNNGQPITVYDNIPKRFQRKPDSNGCIVPGTDIMIMGRAKEDGDIEDITKSVLTHYWLAIVRNKLKVIISAPDITCVEINQATISDYMDNYFDSTTDNVKRIIYPRPYYNAVVKADLEPGCICVRKTLPKLGEVELYLQKNKEARTDRIAFFRLPCMMIMRKSTNQLMLNISNYGIYGTFVCLSDKGDRLLKRLENPAHNEWNEKNWRDSLSKRIVPEAKAVMDELRNFLGAEIEQFCKIKDRTTMKMIGAGKYLYTFTDIVDNSDVDALNPEVGIVATDKFYDAETGVRNSSFVPPPDMTGANYVPKMRDGKIINDAGGATIEDEPTKSKKRRTTVVVTPPSKPRNKKTSRNTGGKTPREANVSDKPASIVMDVTFKVCANRENSQIIHYISLTCEDDAASAKILFSAKREDGRFDNELEIVNTYGNGNAEGMLLRGVRLHKGENMLKIKFSDNLKHILDMDVSKMFN